MTTRTLATAVLALAVAGFGCLVDDGVLDRITRQAPPGAVDRAPPGEIRGFCVVTATPDTIPSS